MAERALDTPFLLEGGHRHEVRRRKGLRVPPATAPTAVALACPTPDQQKRVRAARRLGVREPHPDRRMVSHRPVAMNLKGAGPNPDERAVEESHKSINRSPRVPPQPLRPPCGATPRRASGAASCGWRRNRARMRAAAKRRRAPAMEVGASRVCRALHTHQACWRRVPSLCAP